MYCKQEKEITNLKLKALAILEKDLCIGTDKVVIKKKLFEAIEEEAKKYFKDNFHVLILLQKILIFDSLVNCVH